VIVGDVRGFLRDLDLRNVFNPSVAVWQSQVHVTFRAFGEAGTKPFDAFYARRSVDGSWSCESLTASAVTWGVQTVADPKLFTTPDGVFATFNTGTPASGKNGLYVMKLWPEIAAPRPCELEGRFRIEKNWAFFQGPLGMSAVYSLAPVVILDLQSPDVGDGPLVFRRREVEGAEGEASHMNKRLTLGTQPLVTANGRLLMVGHEKFWIGRRRGYAGRPVSLTGLDTGRPRVTVGRRRLVHTVRDALPRARPAHNPNLLSATYFAGLAVEASEYVLSYGVNDVSFGVANVGVDLWSS
jgi:hypothetical protein